MIKFFRNIRRKLLKENRFKRYMLYAIGEIILVVIGILIALQINNWNEIQKLRAQEKLILAGIQDEFISNLKILDSTMHLNELNIKKSLELGEYLGPSTDSLDQKTFSNLMVGAFKEESRYLPILGLVNELTNSGKLSLLSDTELRKAISSWSSDLDRVANQEDYVVERRDISHSYFLNTGNFRDHLEKIKNGSSLVNITPSKFPKNDYSFLRDQSFESNFYLFITASSNLQDNYYKPLREKINFIIHETRQE
ncbi:hypothetical protein E0K83_11980 [Gramella sp. BOM4]|nr:hypothetical protein [Christiangramia bathymodioli]